MNRQFFKFLRFDILNLRSNDRLVFFYIIYTTLKLRNF